MVGSAAVVEENAAELVIALADRFYAAIFSYLYHMLYDRGLAQELTQEAFL